MSIFSPNLFLDKRTPSLVFTISVFNIQQAKAMQLSHGLRCWRSLLLVAIVIICFVYFYVIPGMVKDEQRGVKDKLRLVEGKLSTIKGVLEEKLPKLGVENSVNNKRVNQDKKLIKSVARNFENAEKRRKQEDKDTYEIRETPPAITSRYKTKPQKDDKEGNRLSSFAEHPKPDAKIHKSDNQKDNNHRENVVSQTQSDLTENADLTAINQVPNVHVGAVNCAKIIKGDRSEITRARHYQQTHPKVPLGEKAYLDMTRDCSKFKTERQYVQKPLSTEEAEFPIAYSILMFKELELAERLLRAIYQPQNYYCLHVDKKSPEAMHKAVEAIARCFDNVFILPKATDVQWGQFSLLEPDLECMEELFKRYSKWRYFINLTGQEFPLKTNLGLVNILKIFNGANNLEGTVTRTNPERTQWVYVNYQKTNRKKSPPPKGIVLAKGAVHITVSRAFVDFMLNDKTAQVFREWVKDTAHPDETFFTSLNHSPQLNVPGAYKGEPETHPIKYPFLTRFKNWGSYPFDYPCMGKRVRAICIFAVGDVVTMANRPELFANKFHLDYHPLALDCMEELHFNRTRQEKVKGSLTFDTGYYKKLDFVKNHV